MKKVFLLLISIVLVSCLEDKKVEPEIKSISEIQNISYSLKSNKLQIFEFILKKDTLFIGNEGTKIKLPKDLFENYTNGKITFELKEFYNKEEMILNGLSTITDKDELLESSGMFYINFKEEKKQLNIKEGKKYEVQVARKTLPNSGIYYNDNDSIFKWKLSEDKIYTTIIDIIKNYKYGLSVAQDGAKGYYKKVLTNEVSKIKKQDSIEVVKLMQEKLRSSNFDTLLIQPNDENQDILQDKSLTENQKKEKIKIRENFYNSASEINNFTFSKIGWINCDRIINPDKIVNLTILNQNKVNATNYAIYFVYQDFKSIITYNLSSLESQTFDNFKIKNSIKAVVFCNSKENIYYDIFYINKNSKTDFELNLKETTLENLKKELVSK